MCARVCLMCAGVAGSGGMQPYMNYPNMYPSNMFYPAMFYPAAAAHSVSCFA